MTDSTSHFLLQRDLYADLRLRWYNITHHLGMSANLAILYGDFSRLPG